MNPEAMLVIPFFEHPCIAVRGPEGTLSISLKSRYRIAKYEHLPSAQYADCVAYIKGAYKRLTGDDLVLPEQSTLDLD